MIDWLIIYGFTSRSRIFHLYGDVTIAGEVLHKFRPILGAQDLWAGSDLYRATPTVTRDLGFSGLIQTTAPFSRLLRHTTWQMAMEFIDIVLLDRLCREMERDS
jgi:hypothetical protein